ncbi:MAG: hypothetical protein WC775_00750 [Patescibacteria group bacterium]|jgi:hypothetical protein
MFLEHWKRLFAGDRDKTHLTNGGLDLRDAELLDVAESRVFRKGGSVLKIYDTPLSRGIITRSTLQLYKRLTGQVSQELTQRSDEWSFSGQCISIHWNVVEIDNLGELPGTGDAWSMSKYVPGINLRDMYYPQWARRQVIQQAVLKGREEQMRGLLDRVSLEVNARLNTDLTDIDLTNVIVDASNTGLLFNVTDVCGIVSKVDGGYARVPLMFE